MIYTILPTLNIHVAYIVACIYADYKENFNLNILPSDHSRTFLYTAAGIALCAVAALGLVLLYKATVGGGVAKGAMENTGEVTRAAEEVAAKLGEAAEETANVAGDEIKGSASNRIIYGLFGYFK